MEFRYSWYRSRTMEYRLRLVPVKNHGIQATAGTSQKPRNPVYGWYRSSHSLSHHSTRSHPSSSSFKGAKPHTSTSTLLAPGSTYGTSHGKKNGGALRPSRVRESALPCLPPIESTWSVHVCDQQPRAHPGTNKDPKHVQQCTRGQATPASQPATHQPAQPYNPTQQCPASTLTPTCHLPSHHPATRTAATPTRAGGAVLLPISQLLSSAQPLSAQSSTAALLRPLVRPRCCQGRECCAASGQVVCCQAAGLHALHHGHEGHHVRLLLLPLQLQLGLQGAHHGLQP